MKLSRNLRRFAAVCAACLPLVSAPVTRASAQEVKPGSEKAEGKSRLVESQVPASAVRMTRYGDVERQLILLKPVAAKAGLKIGTAEVLVWGGIGNTAGVANNTKIFLAWGLRDKKYRYDVIGEEVVEGARLTYFLVRKTEGPEKMLLGCWMATGTEEETQLALVWATVTRGGAGKKAGE